MLSVIYAKYKLTLYAECHYAEGRGTDLLPLLTHPPGGLG
jgi:hypothetical protein